MDRPVPLFTLLSQALVAFTIELDNEFERQMPHRTSDYGSTGTAGSPWLVSMVMWTRFLQFIPAEGIAIRALQPQLRMPKKELDGWLQRLADWWGYLILDRNGSVRPSSGGRQAQEIWRPLTSAIETRWQARIGKRAMDGLHKALTAVATDPAIAELPDSLPILGYGLITRPPDGPRISASREPLSLPTLLSKPLFAFALEFERDAEVSLAISANLLRLLADGLVRVSDLPRLSGVSKESIATAAKFLDARGYAKIGPESPGSRLKALSLTPKGRIAREKYEQLVRIIDARWQDRFGVDTMSALRERLQALPLLESIEPPPTGWRARIARPETLPHFPMILHRGGYPDGA